MRVDYSSATWCDDRRAHGQCNGDAASSVTMPYPRTSTSVCGVGRQPEKWVVGECWYSFARAGGSYPGGRHTNRHPLGSRDRQDARDALQYCQCLAGVEHGCGDGGGDDGGFETGERGDDARNL